MRCTEEQVLYEQSDCKRLPVKQYKGVEGSIPCPTTGHHSLYRKQERRKRALGWRRTHKDPPFADEWEQIRSWVMANLERSSGDIFRELQHRSPGRYHPLQIRTREPMHAEHTSLPGSETREEQWQVEE